MVRKQSLGSCEFLPKLKSMGRVLVKSFKSLKKSPRGQKRLSEAQKVKSRLCPPGAQAQRCQDVSCPQWTPRSLLVPESAWGWLTIRVGGDGDDGMRWVEKVLSSQALAIFPSGGSRHREELEV